MKKCLKDSITTPSLLSAVMNAKNTIAVSLERQSPGYPMITQIMHLYNIFDDN